MTPELVSQPRCQSAYTPATTAIATTTEPIANALQCRLSSPATICASEDDDTGDDRSVAESEWTRSSGMSTDSRRMCAPRSESRSRFNRVMSARNSAAV